MNSTAINWRLGEKNLGFKLTVDLANKNFSTNCFFSLIRKNPYTISASKQDFILIKKNLDETNQRYAKESKEKLDTHRLSYISKSTQTQLKVGQNKAIQAVKKSNGKHNKQMYSSVTQTIQKRGNVERSGFFRAKRRREDWIKTRHRT